MTPLIPTPGGHACLQPRQGLLARYRETAFSPGAGRRVACERCPIPQPSTLNPQPSTLNPQPSTLNPQPSTCERCPWSHGALGAIRRPQWLQCGGLKCGGLKCGGFKREGLNRPPSERCIRYPRPRLSFQPLAPRPESSAPSQRTDAELHVRRNGFSNAVRGQRAPPLPQPPRGGDAPLEWSQWGHWSRWRPARSKSRGNSNPQPPTLNPQPSTRNPQPSTRNPQPSTLNPQPSTLNPQPSTLNPQPPNFSSQPSTLNFHLPTFNSNPKP